ncbi:MAG TPA: hypothetical protein VF646_09520 [Cytophagales bacterium]|jgi:hypothetical protein
MELNAQFLAIIGRRMPALYDLIPRGPLSRFSEVMLNPQPLPPQALGAALAGEFLHAAWHANLYGQDPGPLFAELDDWCPTFPRRLKLPPWWPPIPEPEPEPEWFINFHVGFAARLAVVAAEGTQLSESLNKVIDRSLSAIEAAAKNQF